MTLYAIGERQPTIDPAAFVHPDAIIIGDVHLGPEASVWPGAVLRGDHGSIYVGAGSSVQDGSVVHCTATWDTVIGQGCVIGHLVHLEGCTVQDDALVGSGAVVLQGCIVGSGALVGASALVAPGTHVPPGKSAMGVPARILDKPADAELIRQAADTYRKNTHWYAATLRRLD
ncbi:MAG: gamma carbonic anhydrase family protein [Actinomycetes bacterium]|jgi:carbonic anhydrase/acetyltransferase-like protein (isoleucine patch superfamily)|nr:gamma carbonic anhydrase family protein [Candidatus Nanopelagicales bacterium]MDP4825000.1 gamma carbonic anhydrase family protein [Candidatus Nanopelagicales bacterium]MDP4887746.1 gamma carbonic anhydrase family protein [Candidatus Nanopelagicales bacterium]